jgi:hypothetical protein
MLGIKSALQEGMQLRGGDIPRPGLFHPSTAGAAQPLPFRCIGQQADYLVGHSRRVASVDDIPGLALPNGFRSSTRLTGDYRSSEGRGFQIDDAKPFDVQAESAGTTRHREKVAGCVVLGQLIAGNAAGEDHVIGDTFASRKQLKPP